MLMCGTLWSSESAGRECSLMTAKINDDTTFVLAICCRGGISLCVTWKLWKPENTVYPNQSLLLETSEPPW